MAIYIKANRLVAEHLNVDKIRLKLQDGNYILWQADMAALGKLYEIPQICERIGAIPLQPWEARQEQDGTVTRQLPVATDERFILHDDEVPETSIDTEQSEQSETSEQDDSPVQSEQESEESEVSDGE